MKTLITALAVTAILTTSRNRHKEVQVRHNNLLSRNAVTHDPTNQIKASHCRFHHGEAVTRDCREHEEAG